MHIYHVPFREKNFLNVQFFFDSTAQNTIGIHIYVYSQVKEKSNIDLISFYKRVGKTFKPRFSYFFNEHRDYILCLKLVQVLIFQLEHH